MLVGQNLGFLRLGVLATDRLGTLNRCHLAKANSTWKLSCVRCRDCMFSRLFLGEVRRFRDVFWVRKSEMNLLLTAAFASSNEALPYSFR